MLLRFLCTTFALLVLFSCRPRRSSVSEVEKSQNEAEVADPFADYNFMPIPAGEFMMGSPDGEEGYVNEHQHRVKISSPFQLMAQELTQEQWIKVMGENPSRFSTPELVKDCAFEGRVSVKNSEGKDIPACPRHPVEQVSWDMVQAFIKKLPGGGAGIRLPTEAEWEYAARAKTTTPFNLGENIDTQRVNFFGKVPYNGAKESESWDHTVASGSLANKNAFGLSDMHGNVWEWTEDRYGLYDTSESVAVDPKGSIDGQERVIRGGCFAYGAISARSAARHAWPSGYRSEVIGFRLLRKP